ncbi:dynactin subunit 1-like isoform X3 [Rhodnius prolixus]|uniref:dynactin subunit 1-like isoform X3 n=1 Tax=Rhodnius prolixus TaxID=13249 RepID=UPI003D18BA68
MSTVSLQVGQRVEVTGKNIQGEVAYVGNTAFAPGKWIGIILDEPKGKNNGTVQNKFYFKCNENCGMFIRQSQLSIITDTGSKIDLSNTSSPIVTSPDDSVRPTPKSRLTSVRRKSSPASHATSSRTSSRQSLSGRSRESRSREDMSSSTSSLASSEPQSFPKRSSFIERSSLGRSGIPQFTPRRPSKTISQTPPSKQTGFVETLKPQFTPGQVVSPPNPSSLTPTPRISQTPEPNPEIESLKEQLKDLSEKLETMRIKYKDKAKEIEMISLQLDQSAEFKAKIMEAQSALKKELERVKREKDEALEAREEMSDMADTLEMATLDKEMAEEKAESLQRDLEQAQERIEELEMEIEILKSELSDKMESAGTLVCEEDGEISSFKMKQIVQQNEKLKDTLVRMRDLSAHEKHEKQKILKDFEEKNADFEQILKSNDKLKARVKEMEEQIDELHTNVDAALGAEEMVETLGQQKLSLEEKVKELEEAVAELEELQEVNDLLQEGFKEQEQDLRQELDAKNLQVWEAQRKTESVLESLADRELTIVKFRELVHRIQEENQELRSQLEISSKTSSLSTSVIPEMLDFKKMFAETKAHARAIELELRHMEVQQAQLHVQYLISFMPDTFLTRGGDGDAIMLILLMPRMLAKCQVLISQLRDKFPPVATIDKTNTTPALQFSTMSRFSAHIHTLQGILHQYVHSLNTCKPETLLKVGASYVDMAQQEKALDQYIELLKREQVDENLNTESLEKIVGYFNTLHPQLLLSSGDCSIHQGQLLADLGKAVLCAIDSIQADANIILAHVQQGDGVSLLKKVQPWFEQLRTHLRQVRRRAEFSDLMLGPTSDLCNTTNAVVILNKILSATASGIIPADSENSAVDSEKLLQILKVSFDKQSEALGERFQDFRSPLAYIEYTMEAIATHISNVVRALQDNEDKYLAIQKDKESNEPPLRLRARQVKADLNAMAGLRKKMESKEEDLREMRLTLRSKQEELQEMALRKDLAEKKLANLTRDHELTVETLKRKLDESQQQLKKKEKEFEETMDHLQKDIDSLEMEKGELKDKLKSLPKKAAMEMIKTAPASLIGEVRDFPNTGSGGPVRVIESPVLLNEIKHLKSLVREEKRARMSLQAKKYTEILDKLQPITVPKKIPDEDMKRIDGLKKKLKNLQKDYINALPTVIDLSDKRPELWGNLLRGHIMKDEMKEIEIRERTLALQNEVTQEILRQKKGASIKTDFTLFPSREMVKAVNEGDFVKVCEVAIPTKDPELSGKVISLNVDMQTFSLIRNKISQIGISN